jgi:hypothetical protein
VPASLGARSAARAAHLDYARKGMEAQWHPVRSQFLWVGGQLSPIMHARAKLIIDSSATLAPLDRMIAHWEPAGSQPYLASLAALVRATPRIPGAGISTQRTRSQ